MTVGICIPCFEPRFDDLVECMRVMAHPHFHFIIVTNEPRPVTEAMLRREFPESPEQPRWSLINTGSDEINLSAWWNEGLRLAKIMGFGVFMVTESDVRMKPESVKRLRTALALHGLSMVGPNLYGRMAPGDISIERTQRGWGRRHPGHRICQTWMVNTFDTMEADERFVWWVADEQHEIRHRAIRGGNALVGSAVYERPLQQDTDPEADDQRRLGNAIARKTFEEEWGFPAMT